MVRHWYDTCMTMIQHKYDTLNEVSVLPNLGVCVISTFNMEELIIGNFVGYRIVKLFSYNELLM